MGNVFLGLLFIAETIADPSIWATRGADLSTCIGNAHKAEREALLHHSVHINPVCLYSLVDYLCILCNFFAVASCCSQTFIF